GHKGLCIRKHRGHLIRISRDLDGASARHVGESILGRASTHSNFAHVSPPVVVPCGSRAVEGKADEEPRSSGISPRCDRGVKKRWGMGKNSGTQVPGGYFFF